MRKWLIVFLFGLCCPIIVCADDSSDQTYGEDASTNNLSTAERLTVLERQVANLNQQNNHGQVKALQSELADLKGRMETLEHSFQELSDQAKEQYKDLDQRLQQSAKASSANLSDDHAEVKKSAKLASNEQAMESPADTNNVETVDNKAEETAYQKAFALLKAKDYPRAVPKLQNFLSKYPNGKYAANAHFWLGEIYLLQGQPDLAIAEYHKVISDFAKSDKVPMAQLKLAFAYQDQGGTAKARAQYQKVLKLYPNTTVAKLAEQKLSELTAATKKNSGNN